MQSKEKVMTPEQTLDWLAEQHKSQCNEDRPVQEWIRSMKLMLPAPVQEPVDQRALQMAFRQWESWKQYALELQEKLVKYEGGAPMVLNSTPPAAPVQEPVGEVIGTNASFGKIKDVKTIKWLVEPLPAGTKLYTTPPAAPVAMPANWFAGMTAEYRKEALRIVTPLARLAVRAELEAAAKAEREACAKVCENWTQTPETTGMELALCATAIRARGNT
jgi:hypothetical protein